MSFALPGAVTSCRCARLAGIGEATALAFAREGAELLLTDLNAEAIEAVAARCRAAGARAAVSLAGDITEAAAPARIADALRRHLGGRLHVLVNNAGALLPA